MPNRSNRVPKYRRHKPTGQAVVTLDGRDYYLGKYASAASKEAYRRLTAEWLNCRALTLTLRTTASTSVSVSPRRRPEIEGSKKWVLKLARVCLLLQGLLQAVRSCCKLRMLQAVRGEWSTESTFELAGEPAHVAAAGLMYESTFDWALRWEPSAGRARRTAACISHRSRAPQPHVAACAQTQHSDPVWAPHLPVLYAPEGCTSASGSASRWSLERPVRELYEAEGWV